MAFWLKRVVKDRGGWIEDRSVSWRTRGNQDIIDGFEDAEYERITNCCILMHHEQSSAKNFHDAIDYLGDLIYVFINNPSFFLVTLTLLMCE